jgi:hypothetical protein
MGNHKVQVFIKHLGGCLAARIFYALFGLGLLMLVRLGPPASFAWGSDKSSHPLLGRRLFGTGRS